MRELIDVMAWAPPCQVNTFYETPFFEEQNGFLWNLDYQPETLLMVKEEPESFCMRWISHIGIHKENYANTADNKDDS